jgi:hypothetical protein
MVRIFPAYSFRDQKLVTSILEYLVSDGYDIIDDKKNPFQENIKPADGVVFFLTRYAAESGAIEEMQYAFRAGKPLVLVAMPGEGIPFELRSHTKITFDEKDLEKTAKAISDQLARVIGKVPAVSITGMEPVYTPLYFAQRFHDFLEGLQPNTIISGWNCKGSTNIAFGTPAGPWETDGFLFENSNYKFVLRSVSRPNSSYLVVESLNLQGQLGNIALNNTGKFRNEKGQVTVLETYDMTVGYGRRSRNDVRQAFVDAGMQGQVITTFNEQEFRWEEVLTDILAWAGYRERAKDILLKAPDEKVESIRQCWLLKINGPNWLQDETVKEGETGFFHADYPSRIDRPEIDLYKRVKPGDFGFAFDYSREQNLVIWFEITAALERENDGRQRFFFKIAQLSQRFNFLASDYSKILLIGEQYENNDQRLFELRDTDYKLLIDLMELTAADLISPLVFNKPTLSRVFSDSAAADIEDSLGFQKDVNALAAVMIYKEVTPPLAIGLFGNWGSGKSFFMHKLQKKITELSDGRQDSFCKKVLQINFNSWHYSDANLWASLITKIFEELEYYGRDKPDELNELFQNLNSTKELIAENTNERSAIERQINLLSDEKAVFERNVATQASKLSSLSIPAILKQLICDTSIDEEIIELKKKYEFLQLDAYKDIEEQLDEIGSYSAKVIKAIKIIPSFFTSWRIFGVFVVFLALWGLFNYLENISDAVHVIFNKLKYLIFGFSAMLAAGINFMRPAMKQIGHAYKKLCALQKTVGTLKRKAEEQFYEERQQLTQKITGQK